MKEPFQTISPEQAKELIDTASVTILDVREPMEFYSGHIPNARNLPVGSVRKRSRRCASGFCCNDFSLLSERNAFGNCLPYSLRAWLYECL